MLVADSADSTHLQFAIKNLKLKLKTCFLTNFQELLSVAAVFKENQSFHGAQEAIQSVLQAIEKVFLLVYICITM